LLTHLEEQWKFKLFKDQERYSSKIISYEWTDNILEYVCAIYHAE